LAGSKEKKWGRIIGRGDWETPRDKERLGKKLYEEGENRGGMVLGGSQTHLLEKEKRGSVREGNNKLSGGGWRFLAQEEERKKTRVGPFSKERRVLQDFFRPGEEQSRERNGGVEGENS